MMQFTECLHISTVDSYDANGNVLERTDPWGFVYTATYDALNHVATQTDPDGTTELNHTAAGNVTYARNAEGQEATTFYDALGRPQEEIDPRGRTTLRSYDRNGNEQAILHTWPGGGGGPGPGMVRHVRTYDVKDRLENETRASVSDALLFTEYSYDQVDNVTAVISGDRRVDTRYDAWNRPIQITDALGQKTIQRYDGVGNLRFVTNRRGHTTESRYDELNRKIEELQPTLAATGTTITQNFSYDAVGNLLTESNPRVPGDDAANTRHVYDDLNRLLSSHKRAVSGDLEIRLVFNEYDTGGLGGGSRQDAVTDANGNRVESDLNFRGQPTQRVYPQDETEEMTYDLVGNPLTRTDEENFTTTYTYFDDNTLESATNAESETTRYEYDINGNRILEERPKGAAYRTVSLYDERSRLREVTNANGDTTLFEYDRFSNLLHQYTPAASEGGSANHVEYQYNVLNRRTHHIQHKVGGNLTTSMGYDPEGNLIARTDPKGQAFIYAYDEINRQTQATYPTTTGTPYLTIATIETEYDNNNDPVSTTETKQGAADGSGPGATVDLTTRTFDLLDRETQKVERGHTIDYSYDDNGNRTGVGSTGGSTVYTFDHRNRLATARLDGGTATTYTYLDNNWPAHVAYTNGTEVTTTYDGAGRRLSVTNRGLAGALISSYGYVYDANSNRSQQAEEQAGFATASQQTRTDYTYDLTDRLTRTLLTELDTGDTLETQYTYYPSYDRATEQVTRTVASVATVEQDRSYTYDETHWLDEIADAVSGDSITYAYDNNGNTLQKTDNTLATPEETHFVYDSRNQLAQTTRGPPASQTIQGRYDYDASGMRIRHLDSDRGNIESICDGPAILDERDAGSGTLLAHYNYADRLLSLKTPASTQYYHFAALDTTANLSDESGNVQVSYRTDAFGEITEQEGSSVNRQVFTGQEHDPNTGLIYFGARYFDPDSARFINQDSYLGEPGTPASLHRYLYAYSNPTVYVDLFGYASVFNPGHAQAAHQEKGSVLVRGKGELDRLLRESNERVAGLPEGRGYSVSPRELRELMQDLPAGERTLLGVLTEEGDNITETERQVLGELGGRFEKHEELRSRLSAAKPGQFVDLSDLYLEEYGKWYEANRNVLTEAVEGGDAFTDETSFWSEPGAHIAFFAMAKAEKVGRDFDTTWRDPDAPRFLKVSAVIDHVSFVAETAAEVGTVGLGVLAKAKYLKLRSATRGGDRVLFSQENVRRTFQTAAEGSPFKFAGRSVKEVAESLRRGAIRPSEIPVRFIVEKGQRIAVDNRSLLALRRAGLEPTKLIDVTSNPALRAQTLKRVQEQLGGTARDVIRVRGAGRNASRID
jgi:RHS repeat-associated protein